MLSPQFIVATFVITQLFDGLFTYVALQQFGLHAEGNPLLATWVALIGPQRALIGAKVLAIGGGVLLYCVRRYRMLSGLTLLYGAVIVAWLVVFRTV